MIRGQIERHAPPGHRRTPTSVDLPVSEECKHVLGNAAIQADRARHNHIGTEHLLLGLLDEKKSFSAEILNRHGVRYSRVHEDLARSPQPPTAPSQPWIETLDEVSKTLGSPLGRRLCTQGRN